ncbi:MAG: hypothetical protein ACLTA5_01625 [Anaerococcus obesiensis]
MEMNVRQGRTFYYTNLSGVNLIELVIKDKYLANLMKKDQTKNLC